MFIKSVSLLVLTIALIASVILGINQKKTNFQTYHFKVQADHKQNVYLGAWVGGFWDNDSKTLNASADANFEQAIGKKLAIANIYSEWVYLADPRLLTTLNTINDNGWVPMITSNPRFFDGCPGENSDNLYKIIASGQCDTFLHSVADNLRSYGKPVFFRFAWEMNLPNMYWSISKANSTPQDFIAAWRHFHDIMDEESVNNVIWVLSFNTSSSKTVPYSQLYPGDNYVDWVAIDGYNWGNTHDWSRWNSFNGVFRNSYNQLEAITNKPVMLSEVNSAPDEDGGDKAAWLKDMLDVQIPDKYPNIGAIVFFDEDKTPTELVDWRMEKSQDYLNVVKVSLNNPLYKSNYP